MHTRHDTDVLDPVRLRDLAAAIADGRLRGRAALQATIDLIAAEESRRFGPMGAARHEIERALFEDPDLIAQLSDGFDDAEPARDAEADTPIVGPPKVEHRRVQRARDDDDPFVAAQRRRKLGLGLAVVGVAGLGALAWVWVRPDPCDELARQICIEIPEGRCSVVDLEREFAAHSVSEDLCESTRAALMDVVAKVPSSERGPTYRKTMIERLGFDPRGDVPVPKGPAAPLGPTVSAVLQGPAALTRMQVDRSHVYFTTAEPGGVFRVLAVGGAPESIATASAPSDLTVTEDFVYWSARATDGSNRLQMWADKKRGTHDPLAITLPEGSTYQPSVVAFLGARVVFVDGPTGAVVAYEPASSGSAVLREPALPGPVMLHGDASRVLWVTDAGQLETVLAAGGPAKAIAAIGRPVALDLDAQHVYWIDASRSTLSRVAVDGGAPEVFAQGPGVQDFVDDGDRIVWTAGDTVFSRSKAGGDIVTVARGYPNVQWVGVDAAAVFWSVGGSVHRLPK